MVQPYIQGIEEKLITSYFLLRTIPFSFTE